LIEFQQCYLLKTHMNFGIVPPDFILEAKTVCESKEIEEIKKTWLSMRVKLDCLTCYRIVTNSTNSIIDVFAKSFCILTQVYREKT
ncbi:MAG: hypothetical protein LLG04_12185, partial [Parachlamydia sp.]|nr:hypothetical protein [Parachlamydia sp.]